MALQSQLLWLQNTNTDVWEKVMIELVKCRKQKVFEELKREWSEYKFKFNCLEMMKYIIKDLIHPCRILLYIDKNLELCNNRTEYRIKEKYKSLERLDNIFKSKIFVYGFELVSSNYINRRIYTSRGLTFINVTLEYKNTLNYTEIYNYLKLKEIYDDDDDKIYGGLMKALCELEEVAVCD